MTTFRTLAVGLVVSGLAACDRLPGPTGLRGPEVLARDGVLGQWAFDCTRPFSQQNPHIVYSISTSGVATEQVIMDVKHNRTTELQDVAELDGGFVQWSQKAGQGIATIVTKIDGHRLQTWHATHSDGTLMVDQGRFAGGSAVPWFSRCAAN